jgi:hypothetical protein
MNADHVNLFSNKVDFETHAPNNLRLSKFLKILSTTSHCFVVFLSKNVFLSRLKKNHE